MGKLRTVSVKFFREGYNYSAGKSYNYVTDDDNAKEGDYALVIGAGNEMCLTRILSVSSGIDEKANKFVVAIVSLEGFEEKQERLTKRLQLQQDVERRAKQIQRQKNYEELLADDEEGKELLKQLRELEQA